MNWQALLAFSDAHPLVTWAVVSMLLSLLLAERSRVDAWAEKHPRLAAALKMLRAVGIDPWHIVASISLLVSKRLPAASKRVPPMLPVLVLICPSLLLFGCASVKPVLRDVNQAAAILCETAYGVEQQAAARGMSVRDLCSLHDVLAPFIDEALRAQKAAAGRAGLPARE